MPIFRLSSRIQFPPPELAETNGLLAVGGDLTASRLIEAYRLGIFPWYSEKDPILWWSPVPRLVLFPAEFHTPRRLARLIRKQPFTVTADTAFKEVVAGCARPQKNREETWITPAMQEAYYTLHQLGFAHSIECWRGGDLAGGLYGVTLDRVFFGESMFSQQTDSSKIALHYLVRHALSRGLLMIDCQMKTDHLIRFGAREISGSEFRNRLSEYIRSVRPQKKWRLQETNKEGIGPADAFQEGRC